MAENRQNTLQEVPALEHYDITKMYDVDQLLFFLTKHAENYHLEQTQKALEISYKLHQGQFRKGLFRKEKMRIPYVIHPLHVAFHAFMMNLDSDDLLATALLHDICEDCGYLPEELPVSERVQNAVRLLTFDKTMKHDKQAKIDYYKRIQENSIAVIIKLIDRCNNLSFMYSGFSKERMLEYIQETRELVIPMLKEATVIYPQYEKACILLKYQMDSIMDSIEELL